YLTRNFNYWSKRGINGPKPVILFGTDLEQFFRNKSYIELDRIQQYGKIYGTFEGTKPILSVAEPELIKQILVKDFQNFTDRQNAAFHPILSKHLVVVNGDDWKRLRSTITPTFSSAKMKTMYPMIRECLTDLLDVLDTYAASNQEIDMKAMYGNYTMDVIATCAFSTKTNTHKDRKNPFMTNAVKFFRPQLSRVLMIRFFPKALLKLFNINQAADDKVVDFFFQLTRRIIQERKSGHKKHNDFIQLVLNAEKSNNVIHDENDINESHHVNEGMNK
ncbi:unnamed protein product, partial [Oppiella nova]